MLRNIRSIVLLVFLAVGVTSLLLLFLAGRPDARQENALNLFSAVSRGDDGELKRLLAAGANPDISVADVIPTGWRKWVYDYNPIMLWFRVSHTGKFFADPTQNRNALKLIVAAVQQGKIPVVETLLKAGVNPNQKADARGSLYWLAFDTKNLPMIRLLLQHGANPNEPNGVGKTPLWAALEQSDADVVDELIRHGADVNLKAADGTTPLHRAKTVPIAQMLLKAGARLNERDGHERTPLHLAAARPKSYISLTKFFLSHGADFTLPDDQNCTPLQVARRLQNPIVVKLLTDAGAKR